MAILFRAAVWLSLSITASLALAMALLVTDRAQAESVSIDWVTVGDPGNVADTSPAGLGAVADTFQIMKYELTNTQYAAFLNAVAATDTYLLYQEGMGTSAYGGITQNGSSGSYSYSVKANMGDKPVVRVSWYEAMRVANWLHNGQGSGSTETGAYTLLNGQRSGTPPVRNPDARFYLPTADQWHKAAFYKGGSADAGYWDYATQSDMAPTPVTTDSVGIGSAGNTGNFANYNQSADWNGAIDYWGRVGNVTSVGTNGGPSAYGTFDMSGNVGEITDLNFLIRGGAYNSSDLGISSRSQRQLPPPGNAGDPVVQPGPYDSDSYRLAYVGFRLAAPVAVPEPATYAMALAGIACGGFSMWRRRKAAA